jgi:hypothetical protein
MSAFISMQEELYLEIYWTCLIAPDTLLQATQTQPPSLMEANLEKSATFISFLLYYNFYAVVDHILSLKTSFLVQCRNILLSISSA